jgi:hypothetical protein
VGSKEAVDPDGREKDLRRCRMDMSIWWCTTIPAVFDAQGRCYAVSSCLVEIDVERLAWRVTAPPLRVHVRTRNARVLMMAFAASQKRTCVFRKRRPDHFTFSWTGSAQMRHRSEGNEVFGARKCQQRSVYGFLDYRRPQIWVKGPLDIVPARMGREEL